MNDLFPVYQLTKLILQILAGVLFVAGVGYAAKLYLDLIEFRDYRVQEMNTLLENEVPVPFMLDRNKEMADMLSAYGPRGGRLKLIEEGRSIGRPAAMR